MIVLPTPLKWLHSSRTIFFQFFLKGRSRMSMVCVPPLGFDPDCEGKWLPLQDEFTPSINSKKNVYKSYKLFKNFDNFFHLLLVSGMGYRIFFITSLVPSITYILPIKIAWAVLEKFWFFNFSKFVYNVCKKFFFELILGANLSCSGNHLLSQYGSNPSGGTQNMLILLRPLFFKIVFNKICFLELFLTKKKF